MEVVMEFVTRSFFYLLFGTKEGLAAVAGQP
jgi:hypothetical protein